MSTDGRTGERWGWIGGWAGSFCWLVLWSGVWIYRGEYVFALAGLIVSALAAFLIVVLAPWRHPETPYVKLITPIMALLITAVVMCIYLEGGPESLGLKWTQLPILLVIFIPIVTVGQRRWIDGASDRQGPS